MGGVSAIKHVFDYSYEGYWKRVATLLLVEDGTAYVIDCVAGPSVWDEYEPIFDTIMNSFRVLE